MKKWFIRKIHWWISGYYCNLSLHFFYIGNPEMGDVFAQVMSYHYDLSYNKKRT